MTDNRLVYTIFVLKTRQLRPRAAEAEDIWSNPNQRESQLPPENRTLGFAVYSLSFAPGVGRVVVGERRHCCSDGRAVMFGSCTNPEAKRKSAGDVHGDVGAAGEADEQVNVVWVAGDNGYYRTYTAAFLGHRHDLRVGRRDVVACERERLGTQHTRPRGGPQWSVRIDVVFCTDGLNQAVDERIGTR
jgi:hypothetical protein